MIIKVFSIFDKAARIYSQPFFMLTRAEAARAMKSTVMDENTEVNRTPQDYYLYELAEFNNETGEFEKSFEGLGCATEFIVETGVVKEFPSKEVEQA